MLVMANVVKERQNELVNEVFDIESRIKELEHEIERLAVLKERRMMEHQLLENIEYGAGVGLEKNGRQSKLSFEDCLVQVFDAVGRPLRMKELIEALEKFGFEWSDYQSAYYHITKTRVVQPTGARGFYNVLPTRGW